MNYNNLSWAERQLLKQLILSMIRELNSILCWGNTEFSRLLVVRHADKWTKELAEKLIESAKPKWYQPRIFHWWWSGYYWHPRNRKARIKWLEKQLDLLEAII